MNAQTLNHLFVQNLRNNVPLNVRGNYELFLQEAEIDQLYNSYVDAGGVCENTTTGLKSFPELCIGCIGGFEIYKGDTK